MAEFTKSKAEDAGWQFVHSDEGYTEPIAGQGILQVVAPSYRAEKTLNGVNVSVEAETMEMLLERIQFIEGVQATMPQTAPATMEATGYPVTPDGEPLKTVLTSDGDYTEAEWSQRQRRDNIVTEQGQQFFEGVGVEGSAEHRSALDDAKQRIAELEQQFENERTIDPFAGEQTKQVVFTTSERIDSPGIGAGGTIVVPEAESGHADTSSRIAAQSSASENERVLEAQRRADAEVKISPARSPTLEAQSEAEQARLDAIVGARDQQPPAERRSDEGAAEQADAAEQAAEDEQEPSATGAARELADELGVDLSEVEGTGTGGKITKADVESAADDG